MESIISSSSSSSFKQATTRSPKITKKNKSKHPLRVVYISNPKKVNTTAADFQATVQRLTGKGAVWNSDLELIQTLPYANNSNNNVSDIISDDSTASDDVKDCGVEFPTPNPSPDTSAGSDDLCFQPLDHYDHNHDAVLLYDLGFPLFSDQDLESSFQSDGLDFFDFPSVRI